MNGYVYMLGNRAMPGVFKIGQSEYHPSVRIAQLSSASGVPVPFELVCYGETPYFKESERTVHRVLREFRIHKGREFFAGEGCIFASYLMHSGYFKAFVPGAAFHHFVGSAPEEMDDWVRDWRDHRAEV